MTENKNCWVQKGNSKQGKYSPCTTERPYACIKPWTGALKNEQSWSLIGAHCSPEAIQYSEFEKKCTDLNMEMTTVHTEEQKSSLAVMISSEL